MAENGGFYRGGRRRRPRVLRAVLCCVLIIASAAMPGCRGCRKDAAKTPEELAREAAGKEEKPKPAFEAKRLVTNPAETRKGDVRPPERRSPDEDGNVSSPSEIVCKVGHWTGVSWENVKANYNDFVGEMEIKAVYGNQYPLPLPATPFELTISRQAALPKGQAKVFDSVMYIPADGPKASITCELNSYRGGGSVLSASLPAIKKMPSYQYHFVVLARVPEQYGFLGSLYSVKPYKEDMDNKIEPYYRITRIAAERRAALPDHALLWTSIACVLWDDAAPSALSPDVQQAFLDWLNWGGQLIISGPDSLDGLKGSFLEPYLPATASGACKLAAAELAEINAFSSNGVRKLSPIRPWSGVQLEKHAQARFVPRTGNLLVERYVGQGRIVATAFRLGEKEFADWPGADQFFNAFLLRRPPRRFERDREERLKVAWADGHETRDAARITRLRFFTRDAGLKWENYSSDAIKQNGPAETDEGTWDVRRFATRVNPAAAGVVPPPGPGVGAWNDFSPAAAAARDILLNAAQVEIPDHTFVFLFLSLYLIVLVPFNWSIFRTIDRVEWAWIAAPVIAIACTGLVIKLAQLDIGFVRARTEVAVLEIQGDYPRGHLTRYNALYTSLSTPYDFSFDDFGAAALPFPSVTDPKSFTLAPGQQRRGLRYVRADQANLEGLPVPSNSTALVHSEEMIDLGGKILLKRDAGRLQIVNQSKMQLQGTGLIKKAASGDVEVCWLGALQPGAIREVSWISRSAAQSGGELWPVERNQSPLTAQKSDGQPKGDLNLRSLLKVAEDADAMRAGEIRLLAWMDAILPGLRIKPAAPQSRHATLVVGHLDYGTDAPPRADDNAPDKL